MDLARNTAVASFEREHSVRVVLAYEYGSRAGGHACDARSDHDVHVVFCRPPSSYLTLDGEARPLAELSLSREKQEATGCEVSGWDVTKALRLLRDSNPCVLEALHPANAALRFRNEGGFCESAWTLCAAHLNPTALLHHYLSTAKKHQRLYFGRDAKTVANSKKYVYTLRPLFCAVHVSACIDSGADAAVTVPPVRVDELANVVAPLLQHTGAAEQLDRFHGLLSSLRASGGVPDCPRDRVLDGLMAELFNFVEARAGALRKAMPNAPMAPIAPFNALCAQTILGQQ